MRSPFMLIGTALISLFLLSACDDQSEEANSCRYYVQQDLDNQNYDSAISRLNSGTCQNTYPDNEHYVDLAAAYLGKSGFTFPKILSAALEDGDDDALSAFTKEISELKNDDSFEYLDLAEEAFINYLGNSCNNLNNKTKSQEGVCLIQGVLSVTKTALALDFLAGDLGIEDSETLDLSACALSYSISGNDNSCPTGVKVKSTSSVTFTLPNSTTTKSYTNLTVGDNDGNSEYFLRSTSTNQIVFTDGFCTNNFTSTDAATPNIDTNPLNLASSAISYVCPSEDATDQSVNEFVIDALNAAINNIESLVSSVGASDADSEELQDAIDEFKSEIRGDNNTNTGDFTLDEIITYLNKLDAE